ncbi:unnamed protein product [marine sediment metagenome]|uniref:Uncharacterized protein n=1 Tax=marine sediment metagenome TaxID=412755 RepID=X1JSU8_9ZZZZ
MKDAAIRGLARLGRVMIAGAAVGSIYSGVDFLQTTPIGIFIIPAGMALVSATGKWFRDKWGIQLPF